VDPRNIDVNELKERRIKPLISFRLKQMPEIDIIAELIEDNFLDYLTVSNLYLAIPIQSPNDGSISLGLRPWSMTATKDQKLIFEKEDVVTYFEITNQVLINSYINSTSDIKIAGPDQMPKSRGSVIDLVRN
jgi:hypothetical protein